MTRILKKIERSWIIVLITGLGLSLLSMMLDLVIYPDNPEITAPAKVFAALCLILLVLIPTFVVSGMKAIYQRKKSRRGGSL